MPSIWADASAPGHSEKPREPPREPRGSSSGETPREDTDTDLDLDLDLEVRLPPRIRTKFGRGLRTAGDAFEVCEALFEEQLERAAIEKPPPNTPISGDSTARSAFLLLLTDLQKRALFLRIANVPSSWPRLRALVGAPPFHFLLPRDAAVLNASGFARGRVNMTYESGHHVANASQFGPGQLVDEHGREYRVAPPSAPARSASMKPA